MANILCILVKVVLSATIMGVMDPVIGPEKSNAKKHLSILIQNGNKAIESGRILRTSQAIFSLMNFELIESERHPGVDFQEGVIIPERLKSRLFGNAPAIGKMLAVDSSFYRVIGIVKDVPERSCLYSDLIIVSNDIEVTFEKLVNIRCTIIN